MNDPPQSRPVALVNPHAGSDLTDALAGTWVLQETAPAELQPRLRSLVASGLWLVGVAGGDGTIRSAAEVLAGTSTSLVALPGGTRNHFAHLVGTPDVAAVEAAMHEARTVRIDIGRCDGHAFVNNASFGAYPVLVARRERMQERGVPKVVAHWIAALGVLARPHTIELTLAGETIRTWMLFVGNGAFGTSLTTLGTRELPLDGMLDVRVVRADRRLARVRVVLALLTGRFDRSSLLRRVRTPACTLVASSPRLRAALDGETITVGPRVVLCSDPQQLDVLVGPGVTPRREPGPPEPGAPRFRAT